MPCSSYGSLMGFSFTARMDVGDYWANEYLADCGFISSYSTDLLAQFMSPKVRSPRF
jgi:hypothetical protein